MMGRRRRIREAPAAPPPSKRPLAGAAGMVCSALMTALVVGLSLVFLILIEANRAGPAPEKIVVIPRGAGVSQIARHLEAEGVIRSKTVFRLASELYARAGLKAGEYRIEPQSSVADVLRQLADGRVLFHGLTVPEGSTSDMVMDIVAAHPVLHGPMPERPPAEGSLLPETYSVERGMSRIEVIAQMQQAQQELLATLWESRAPNLPFDTPEEAVILASIVEKETGVASERPQVAAVFVNRLRKGMRLESDPTIIYGLTKGRPLGRGLRRSEIDQVTPYNTYRIDGLPPTPIANPGRAALAAVLDPPQSDALFFVADGSGGHVFAATYAEHQRNVARWREVERAQASAASQTR